jgi:hypothetical protein
MTMGWWFVAYRNHPEVAPAFIIMKVPGEASWLKEFFNVEVTVKNNADTQFELTDSKLKLQLPDGLSLAPTNESQSLEVDLGTIKGGETRTQSWVIRGDKQGEYNISADFNGNLQPFDDSVYYQFRTKEPVKVWGGKAMHMDVYADAYAYKGRPYLLLTRFTNVSDHSVNNLSNEIKPGEKYTIPASTVTKRSILELKPGESVTWAYMIIPNFNGELSESLSWVALVGGEYIPSTFHSLPRDQGVSGCR